MGEARAADALWFRDVASVTTHRPLPVGQSGRVGEARKHAQDRPCHPAVGVPGPVVGSAVCPRSLSQASGAHQGLDGQRGAVCVCPTVIVSLDAAYDSLGDTLPL